MSWLKLATPAVAQLSLVLFIRCLVRIGLGLRCLSHSVICRGVEALVRRAGDKPQPLLRNAWTPFSSPRERHYFLSMMTRNLIRAFCHRRGGDVCSHFTWLSRQKPRAATYIPISHYAATAVCVVFRWSQISNVRILDKLHSAV